MSDTNEQDETASGQLEEQIPAAASVNEASQEKTRHSKTLKEYLLDGLMIFLAVALGFISENIRENIIENSRTKVFAAAMVDDLKSDTTELKAYLAYMTYASANVDSLLNLFLTNDLKDIPTGKLYWYGLWGGARRTFIPNDATFQQMKSSGSLRYIRSHVLLKEIVDYDQLCRQADATEDRDNNLHTEVRNVRGQIFDYKYNMEANSIYQANRETPDQERIDVFMKSDPLLITNDRSTMNQYLELVRSRNLGSKVAVAEQLLREATALIEALKTEYGLE